MRHSASLIHNGSPLTLSNAMHEGVISAYEQIPFLPRRARAAATFVDQAAYDP